jgi:predicted NBD/HSP70 family sugar kinase
LDQPGKTAAPLDPGFRPIILAVRNYRAAVAAAENTETVSLAVERNSGLTTRMDIEVLPAGTEDEATFIVVERTLKFLLWARGGWKVYVSGSSTVCDKLVAAYSPNGTRAFDVETMKKAYGRSFEIQVVSADDVPAENESGLELGGNLNGCRIGFDLGASDYKLSAVVDGEPVFTTEIRWDPVGQTDPEYHLSRIREGLTLAASKMERVDAIGGSSAGIYVESQVMNASLFRSIDPAEFERLIKPMFLAMRKEWNVPFEVINDGDVTAIAGAMSLGRNAILGIAMGSSEAVGYVNAGGHVTGWLNELAFCPVDVNSVAAPDEWSGDLGVGAMYFSQQAVNKLAPAAGYSFPEDMLLPERLKEVQAKMAAGDEAAADIYRTIGVYLGYAVAWYAEFYDFGDRLILGRVLTGRGGDIIIEEAQKVLNDEFPEYAKIGLNVPDEKMRRHGQAVAAASLPATS